MSLFSPFATWVQNHSAQADLIIGLVSPIIVLAVMTLRARGDAVGALNIDAQLQKARAQTQNKVAKSSEAAGVIAVTLSASGLLLLGVYVFWHARGAFALSIWIDTTGGGVGGRIVQYAPQKA